MHKSRIQLHDHNRTNRAACRFAEKALDDYLLARLGIQHGLVSSFEVSTTSIEKLVKSYLLFRDPSFCGSPEKLYRALTSRSRLSGRSREHGHDVDIAIRMAADLGLTSSEDLRRRLSRINSYYARRYPDNGGPTSLSSTELQDIDEAVFEIWDFFEQINADYYYVCGISMPVYAFVSGMLTGISYLPDNFRIMSSGNLAYARRKQHLEAGARERLLSWYGEQLARLNRSSASVRLNLGEL